MADSGRCCNRMLTLNTHCCSPWLWHSSEKSLTFFTFFWKEARSYAPIKSPRCRFAQCQILRNSRWDSGWTKRKKKTHTYTHSGTVNNFLDKMTVENVAVFLSVVGSAGTCWRFHRSIFGPPRRKRRREGGRLVASTRLTVLLKKPTAKFCVSQFFCVLTYLSRLHVVNVTVTLTTPSEPEGKVNVSQNSFYCFVLRAGLKLLSAPPWVS